MSGKKYVPENVYLVCDKGSKVSQLKSFSYSETTLYGEHMCTKIDKKLIVNFEDFGSCSCNYNRKCTAPVTDWTNITDGITLGGNELLLEHSELPCTMGGIIKIHYSMQEAIAVVQAQKKGFWSSLFDTALDINNKVLDFEKGLAKGLWKGLKGTVVGVYDLSVWAGKHSVPYMVLNPQGYAEQLQKDEKTFKAIGNVAKKAGTWVYRNSTINAIANPQDFMAAQQENAVMMDKLYDKASDMSAEEWGDFTGQVLFEVGLEVATVGAAAALTAVKVVDKGLDAVKIINKLDDLADGAKLLEKADDLVDGARVLENAVPPVPDELGKVVNNKGLNSNIDDALKKFDSSTATNKQKGNFGEMKAYKNHTKNPDLKQIGKKPPKDLGDKIQKGIDGIYENTAYPPPPKFIIDEAKYGTSRLGKTKSGKQMSDDWIKDKKYKRIRDQFRDDPAKAKEVIKAFQNGEVQKTLSRIDRETLEVTTTILK